MNPSDRLLEQLAASDPAHQVRHDASDDVFRRVQGQLDQVAGDGRARTRVAFHSRALRRAALPALVLGVTLMIFGVVGFAVARRRGQPVSASSSGSSPAQRLADGTVNCVKATSGQPPVQREIRGRLVEGPSLDGQSPITYCRLDLFNVNGHETAAGRTVALVACEGNPTTVDVYLASGAPDQCEAIGEKPLPAGFPVAEARLRELGGDLTKLNTADNCVSLDTLTREIKSTLSRLGLAGWQTPRLTVSESHGYAIPAGTGGSCGTSGFDSQHQEVSVTPVPSRSVQKELQHVSYELYRKSYERCYTAATIRTLVANGFATMGMVARFATVSRQPGTHYEPASERNYLAGCVRFNSAWTGNNNTFVDVELVAKGAPQLAPNQFFPPATDFAP